MDFSAVKDWVDALSKLATPFALVWIGLLIVKRVEMRKAGVARSSDFKKRWADNFYDTSQEFMRSTERYMSILNQFQLITDPDGVHGTKLQEELSLLNVRLGELHLAIRRLSYFAPTKGLDAIKTATSVQDYLAELIRSRKGSFDKLISLQNAFNQAVREAHAEMLDFE
ncbi:MAG: hypothetical protein H6R15_413 [Proteobacteria bacterium]|nr:hypothetical protein [Pseudomonadota bacterium]